jgi:uncharacterized protein
MSRHHSAENLHVAVFARDGGTLSGEVSLKDLGRLAQETLELGQGRTLQWHAQGQLRPVPAGAPEIWLHLQVQCVLALACQRCLGVVDYSVHVDRWFRFAPDEGQAARLDEELEADVLALSPDFRLMDLIEDEVLLELPLVARHDACPSEPSLSVQDADFQEPEQSQPHPFAALAGLKSGPRGGKIG